MRTQAIWITLVTLVTTGLSSTIPVQRPFEMTPSPSFVSSSSSPSLTDLLTRSKNSRLFYDYIRESTSVSTRLANPLESTTILAPISSAIVALPRRPHQGPPVPVEGHVEGYSGSREDEEARAEYLEKWIKRHLIADRIDLEDLTKEYETLQGGEKISFVTSGGEGEEWLRVMPGDIEVVEIEQASNGVILYLRGTLNLDNVD
ncbi:uncharacterized protein JCM6883_000895 [Sporobolomyces salmoneus]|uniref:uncharacterized protein n=1 Tax=Sporobolomyces salmoneus TaxID=183962 RepID=UPI00316EB3C7